MNFAHRHQFVGVYAGTFNVECYQMRKGEKIMVNYFDVVVCCSRVLNNPRARKGEVEKVARSAFQKAGREFNPVAFSKAFTDFRKAETRSFRNALYT